MVYAVLRSSTWAVPKRAPGQPCFDGLASDGQPRRPPPIPRAHVGVPGPPGPPPPPGPPLFPPPVSVPVPPPAGWPLPTFTVITVPLTAWHGVISTTRLSGPGTACRSTSNRSCVRPPPAPP